MPSNDRDNREDSPCGGSDLPSAESQDTYPEDHGWTADPDGAAGLHTRRQFLKGSCVAVGAGLVGGFAGCKRSTGKSEKKVEIREKEPVQTPVRPEPARPARPGTRAQNLDLPEKGKIAGRGQVFAVLHEHAAGKKGGPAAEPMGKVLDHLVRELTGRSKPADGWAALFKPHDIVGIKPNAFAQNWCMPAVELVRAVIERLHGIGVPYKNILIWDHWNFQGSDIYKQFRRGPAVLKRQVQWGYDRKLYRLPTTGWTKFNRAITQTTAIVNMPVFKDHDLAGATCSMKNLSHGSIINPAHHHKNCCSPSIPEIYGLPMIKDKVRLIIADAFRVIYQGGPFGARSRNYNVRHNMWFASTDPVAMDKIAWETIDAHRTQKGMPTLMKRRHMRGKPRGSGRPIHIPKAEALGLGVADRGKIKVYKKTLG
jgi:uncharacterized protein (DUF362 family)